MKTLLRVESLRITACCLGFVDCRQSTCEREKEEGHEKNTHVSLVVKEEDAVAPRDAREDDTDVIFLVASKGDGGLVDGENAPILTVPLDDDNETKR